VVRLFTYGLVCAALPVLRLKDRLGVHDAGPARFRSPMGIFMAAVGVAASATLATRMNLREAVTMGIVIILASGYWLLRKSPPLSRGNCG
jgi:hypothetical protein